MARSLIFTITNCRIPLYNDTMLRNTLHSTMSNYQWKYITFHTNTPVFNIRVSVIQFISVR